MIVVIPHQSDAQKIMHFQRQLKRELNALLSGTLIFYDRPPVWIPLPERLSSAAEAGSAGSKGSDSRQKNALKNIEIDGITMLSPYFDDGKVVSDIKIRHDGKDFLTKYAHLYTVDEEKCSDDEKKLLEDFFSSSKSLFPMQIKIFRLADAEKLSANSMAVANSVWVKLR